MFSYIYYSRKLEKMKVKFYKNIKTKEIVYEDDMENYVLDELGVTVTPKGKNGELTLEQTEFILTFTEWYFSDNWIEEWEDLD
jgi:hypothetical protein